MSETKRRYLFPSTLRGWRTLFWLAVRRCPLCHGRTCLNWPWDSHIRYCMPCGGAMWPVGIWDALEQNYRAVKRDAAKAIEGASNE